MPKITNPNYLKFMNDGIIDTLKATDIERAFHNITGRYKREGRALLITLYLTGARPVEVLGLKSKDVTKEDSYVKVHILPSKRGLVRTVFLQSENTLVKELYQYAQGLHEDMLLFYHFRSNCKPKRIITKKGEARFYNEVSNKLRWHINKWFTGIIEGSISPYFLRHNRFSKLMEAGASNEEIRILKGAKSIESVRPYTHLSTKTSKSLAKKIS